VATVFKDYYRDMSKKQVKKAEMRAVFTESPNVLNWCDPCGANPLVLGELPSQGVTCFKQTPPEFFPGRGRRPIMPPMGGARDASAASVQACSSGQHWRAATASVKYFPIAYPAAA
jgi:hypothetical protein